MHSKRRSGRITKELAIVLLGTDTTGKVFSEETKTVVLSRHGAGVLSRYRFTPDEVLTLRLPDSTKEAVVRLVGQIGGEPGRYVYGLAFVDPDPHFWPMEFPPPESFDSAIHSVSFECSFCHARQDVQQGDIEDDVYSVLGNILRFCPDCGISTPWKKAQRGPLPASAAKGAKLNLSAPPPLPSLPKSALHAHAPAFAGFMEPALSASLLSISDAPESPYSAASTISEFASLSDIQSSTMDAVATAVLPAPQPTSSSRQLALPAVKPGAVATRELDANGRRINKRRHVRIRVSFTACVRHPAHADEIVECENISKGGLCFHSLRQYALDSLLEIAAPFSPGEPCLFVPSQIKRVEALSGGEVFRYGVEYTFRSPAQQS
ncbi:MAG: PilZ domain-containing protein [Candidatus Acidiferrum sp.]